MIKKYNKFVNLLESTNKSLDLFLNEELTETEPDYPTSYINKNLEKLLKEFVEFKDNGIFDFPLWKDAYKKIYDLITTNNVNKDGILPLWTEFKSLYETRELLFFYVMEEAKRKYLIEKDSTVPEKNKEKIELERANTEALYKLIQRFPTVRAVRDEFYEWCNTKQHELIVKPKIDEDLVPETLLMWIDKSNLQQITKDGFKEFLSSPEVDVYYIMKHGCFLDDKYFWEYTRLNDIQTNLGLDAILKAEKRKKTYDEQEKENEMVNEAWKNYKAYIKENLTGFKARVRDNHGDVIYEP